jgi:hypothetical protein
MFASFRKLATAAGVVALMSMSTGAQAAELNGSMALVGINVSQDLANLGISTLISATDTLVSSAGAGDYAAVPAGTLFGPHSIDLSSLTGNVINNIGTFSLSNAGFGSFTATSGNIVQRSANFLDIFVLGTFTPAGARAGFDPTATSLRFSINQSGDSVSSAITLNSPPVQVPEPAALALLGVAALGVVRYRRSRS